MNVQSQKVKPSATLYLLPLLVFLVSAGLGVVLIVSGFTAYSDTIDNFGRVPLNGEGVVTFSKRGKFTAFLEQPGIDSIGTFAPAVSLEMTKVDGATPVVFKEYSGSGSYSNGGHEGAALKTFRIDEPGDYRLVTSGEGSGEVAVGRSPFGKLGRGVITGVVVGGAGFVLAIILVIMLAVMRGGSKRRVRAAQFAAVGAYGPGPGPQPQWQPQPQPFGPPGGSPPPYTPPPPYAAPGPPPAGPGPSWPSPPTSGSDDPTRPG